MNEDSILIQVQNLCEQKEYALAKSILLPYLQQNPKDSKANFLMVRILTEDYTLKEVSEDFESYFQTAILLLPEKEKKEKIQQYNRYIETIQWNEKVQQLAPSSDKKTIGSNILVFLLSCCFMIGLIFCLYEEYVSGIILMGLAFVIGVIQWILHYKKK